MITQSLAVPATPHRAWQAWAEPQYIVEWFSDQAGGGPLPGDELVWQFNGFDRPMGARVVRSHPGRELILSLDAGPSASLLEVRFESLGDATNVILVQSGLPEGSDFDELAVGIASGWANALEYLKLYLAQYQGLAKRSAAAMAPITQSCETAMQWFEPGLKRERWLDVPATELQPGWRAPRHVAWRWPGIDGVLEMSAFETPGMPRTACVRAVYWRQEPVAGLEDRVIACVERLAALLS